MRGRWRALAMGMGAVLVLCATYAVAGGPPVSSGLAGGARANVAPLGPAWPTFDAPIVEVEDNVDSDADGTAEWPALSREAAPEAPVPQLEPQDATAEAPRLTLTLSGDSVPDEATLREMIAAGPETLGSLSIGTPDAGVLFNALQMTDGQLWRIRQPETAWATAETIAFLETAIDTVEARHPGSPPVLVGDISSRPGGRLKRHKSHQCGRDADLGWYFTNGVGNSLQTATSRNLDLDRSWELVRAFVTETDVDRIFIDRSIQRLLWRHALERGEDREWLSRIFQCAAGRSDTIVQHERRHKNHMHVRFFNRRAQEWGRVAYPVLVAASLAPPPVIIHHARRGETLGMLARRYGARASAIRAANGLASTRLRAGQAYRIPVRLAVAASLPPVEVPSRRLPPARTEEPEQTASDLAARPTQSRSIPESR